MITKNNNKEGQPRSKSNNEQLVLEKYSSLINLHSSKKVYWKNFDTGDIILNKQGKGKNYDVIDLWFKNYIPCAFKKYDAYDTTNNEYIEIKPIIKNKNNLYAELGKICTKDKLLKLYCYFTGDYTIPKFSSKDTKKQKDIKKQNLYNALINNYDIIEKWNEIMINSYEFICNRVDIDKIIKKYGIARKIYTLNKMYSMDDINFYWVLREKQNMGIKNIRGCRIEIHWNV